MPSPFPGFDPYLENRYYWSTVHAPLLVALQQAIRRRLPRGFIASVEQHLAIEIPSNDFWATGRDAPASRQPDITVFETGYDGAALLAEKYALPLTRPLTEPEVVTQDELAQRFVHIYDRRNGRRKVVAIVELLSPANKDGAEGTVQYKRKQREARDGGVHLLEIDLLRYGAHVAYVPKTIIDDTGAYDYLVTLADAEHPREYRFWRIGVREPLPALTLPLTPDVAPVPLDLQGVFDTCYDASGLGDGVDYAREPEPPLPPGDAAWADGVLRAAGLR